MVKASAGLPRYLGHFRASSIMRYEIGHAMRLSQDSLRERKRQRKCTHEVQLDSACFTALCLR